MTTTKNLADLFREHHGKLFEAHGTTPRGVDWGDAQELEFRYRKMMEVVSGDLRHAGERPSLLDVGCGWGGLKAYCDAMGTNIKYAGIDVVPEMVESGRNSFPDASFLCGDLLNHVPEQQYDYLVCNGTLTQKLDANIPAMQAYARSLIRKMFELCRHGIAFNLMSNRVNFMVGNLYYNSPVEILAFCLDELSPRVRLDHGYSALASGRNKLFDFTVYVYRD